MTLLVTGPEGKTELWRVLDQQLESQPGVAHVTYTQASSTGLETWGTTT